MIKIIFLCAGNTCRSQMAEGFAKSLGKGRVEAFSAGVKAGGFLNPLAVKVMQEIGVDISGQHSKMIDHQLLSEMDVVVTICSDAEEKCPVTPPRIKRIHIPIDDPSKLSGSEEEMLGAFRKTRETIKDKVQSLLLSFGGLEPRKS